MISSPIVEIAAVSFVVVYVVGMTLNLISQRENANDLKIARAERQKAEEEGRQRARASLERTAKSQECTDKINERTGAASALLR